MLVLSTGKIFYSCFTVKHYEHPLADLGIAWCKPPLCQRWTSVCSARSIGTLYLAQSKRTACLHGVASSLPGTNVVAHWCGMVFVCWWPLDFLLICGCFEPWNEIQLPCGLWTCESITTAGCGYLRYLVLCCTVTLAAIPESSRGPFQRCRKKGSV